MPRPFRGGILVLVGGQLLVSQRLLAKSQLRHGIVQRLLPAAGLQPLGAARRGLLGVRQQGVADAVRLERRAVRPRTVYGVFLHILGVLLGCDLAR